MKTKRPKTIAGLLALIFSEIFRQKKFLLIPIWILVVVIAGLFFFSGGSYLLPAIYLAF